MAAQRLPLRLFRTSAGAAPRALVRELTGADELAIDGVGTRAAMALLSRLVSFDAPLAAEKLNASDRDWLLAALYRLTYGERVSSTIRCGACQGSFDLDFSLAEIARQLAITQAEAIQSIVDDVVVTRDGVSVRIPDGDDELSASELPMREAREQLVSRCDTGASTAASDPASVLERVAPIFDFELDAKCAECGHAQPVSFDLQSFLLRRLLGDRAQLHADIHALAGSYGWSLGEILALTRRQRRSFVDTLDTAHRRASDARRRSAR